ncbi:unnamed protein product [Acanthoscelides obtectus]|uniref:Uncharacterized protein n=1 Tax=Acanthoscelides obtectus TaxID=200917 RepID=A0A9P0K3L9_ACAOB|nr:unnamed protein product [Acanthoscelides obtectus]CAK1658260.1 Cyclin-G-associated kinase [Acanthoscelides obtectus]
MSDLFKSAFEYFSGPANGQNDNPFVGQIVEISNVKLRIKRVIAEGGFAVVFAAQDVATGKEYALKVNILLTPLFRDQYIISPVS